MALLTRRTLLAASATVMAGLAPRKPARAAGIDMRPFSDIVKANPPTSVPDVQFQTLDGGQKSLASFAGRPIVLNFWATWCEPCVAELPELDTLSSTDPGIVVLAVSADRGGAGVVKPFLAAHKIDHATILLDPGSDAVHALGVAGFPTTLLIGADGKLRGTLEGPAAGTIAGMMQG
jgi:thiol-disulfide isomerase/thioredoxin